MNMNILQLIYYTLISLLEIVTFIGSIFFFFGLPIITVVLPFYYSYKLICAIKQNKKQQNTFSDSQIKKILFKLCISIFCAIVVPSVVIGIINALVSPIAYM